CWCAVLSPWATAGPVSSSGELVREDPRRAGVVFCADVAHFAECHDLDQTRLFQNSQMIDGCPRRGLGANGRLLGRRGPVLEDPKDAAERGVRDGLISGPILVQRLDDQPRGKLQHLHWTLAQLARPHPQVPPPASPTCCIAPCSK